MVPTAYLRAFEPLDAFPALEREWWGGYVERGAGVSLTEARATEDRVAVARLLTGRGSLNPDTALVRRVGGRIHLCPLQLELRAATAMQTFLDTVPIEVVDAFVPDVRVRQSLSAISRPDRPPHIRDAAWAVPLPWFTAFAPEERHLVNPLEGRGPRLTYLTTGGLAATRVQRAISIVETAIEDGESVLAELADVGDWIESFSSDALLELDYGGVAKLVSRPELGSDRTCSDVWGALDALAEGDAMAAAAYYGVARSRWSALRDKQYAS